MKTGYCISKDCIRYNPILGTYDIKLNKTWVNFYSKMKGVKTPKYSTTVRPITLRVKEGIPAFEVKGIETEELKLDYINTYWEDILNMAEEKEQEEYLSIDKGDYIVNNPKWNNLEDLYNEIPELKRADIVSPYSEMTG